MSLLVDLPEGFRVLDAADPRAVEVADVPEPLRAWYADVVAARAAAGAVLLALQVERPPDGARAALSAAVHLHPLDPAPAEVVVQGLRAIALARTSPAGEVSVLDLPLGPAVASADVRRTAAGTPAAFAVLQLPVPALGRLVTLTLCTPVLERLATCAAVTAAIGARMRIEDEEAVA